MDWSPSPEAACLSARPKAKGLREHHKVHTRTWVYGERIDDLIQYINVTPNPDVEYWSHADHLGSVMLMVSSTGRIQESYRYTEWGEVTVVDEDFDKLAAGAASPIDNSVLYTGQRRAINLSPAGETWYDYRARQYRAEVGRFVQANRGTSFTIHAIPSEYTFTVNRMVGAARYSSHSSRARFGAYGTNSPPTGATVAADCFPGLPQYPHKGTPPPPELFPAHCLTLCLEMVVPETEALDCYCKFLQDWDYAIGNYHKCMRQVTVDAAIDGAKTAGAVGGAAAAGGFMTCGLLCGVIAGGFGLIAEFFGGAYASVASGKQQCATAYFNDYVQAYEDWQDCP